MNPVLRNLRDSDFSACVGIANRAFAFDKKITPRSFADFYKKMYVGRSLAASNFHVVVEEDGVVKGMLFAKQGEGGLYKNRYSEPWGTFHLLLELFSVPGVSLKNKLDFLRMEREHESNRVKIEPRGENEVNLLAVDPQERGKGHGAMLMRAFIDHCKSRQVGRFTLDTDTGCDYQFFQHLGFRRQGVFYSPIEHAVSGVLECYVYEFIL
jgi:ribosomal protein S18 acetylase RimI-like enzyme